MSHFTGNRQGETFVGNCGSLDAPATIPEYLCDLRTARLGDLALDIEGKKLPSNYRPLFIGQAEIDQYNRIMEARLSAIRRG